VGHLERATVENSGHRPKRPPKVFFKLRRTRRKTGRKSQHCNNCVVRASRRTNSGQADKKSGGTLGTRGTARTRGTAGTSGTAFQPRSAASERPERRNCSICRNYGVCLTLSYFFSKIVGQIAKTAVTLIELASCVSHLSFGTAWDRDIYLAGILIEGSTRSGRRI
jgi:hypothetical protein